MTGKDRREDILNTIKILEKPISGTELAKKYGVSRQVIVQDIAILRAENYKIYSTNRGYLLENSQRMKKVFEVSHTDEQIEDELTTIIDLGGTIVDVFVEHQVYGSLKANLNINSRRKVAEFLEKIRNGEANPLKNLTFGKHFHTIEADSEETLELIEKELKEKGYLK